MLPQEQTPRQRIVALISGTLRSARQLAELVGIPERQVEDHLTHIVRSLSRDRAKRFVLEPSECRDCGYGFRNRTRLTTPSRCPRCRSEAIAPPRYGIDLRTEQP
ncbi:MAG: transcriptional regulator [Nitrospira sp.]|nr:transcriptional regulator [Nitrospira sp.]